MTGNTPSATVTLDFRCSVTQWTGENWDDVSLALTTGDQVSQLIQVPEPNRIDISLGPTSTFPLVSTQEPARQPAEKRSGKVEPNRDCEPERRQVVPIWDQQAPLPVAPVLGASEAPGVEAPSKTVSWLISHVCFVRRFIVSEPSFTSWGVQGSKDLITHVANGSMFVPSDHAAHHVLVASLSLQAEFVRIAVPSIDTRVYYTVRSIFFLSLPYSILNIQCVVKNTSEYVLLPGTIKAYLNNKHVSSAEIQVCSSDGSMIGLMHVISPLEHGFTTDTGMLSRSRHRPEDDP